MISFTFKENSNHQFHVFKKYWREAAKSRLGQHPLLAPEDKGETSECWMRKENLRVPATEKSFGNWVQHTEFGFGSVVPLVLSPTNQLHNRTLQCKLEFFIPTVCQRGLFIFVFWIQQLVTEVKCFHGSFSAVARGKKNKNVCLTHTSFKYMQGSTVSKMQELGTF